MFPDKLYRKLEQRITNNSLRKLSSSNDLIDFSSNDYLGFAKSEELFAATHHYLNSNGYTQNGATGSRLLSGNNQLYISLEQQLQQVHGADALLYNSGYDANVGFFSAVPQRNDVVLYDEYVHASIRDGIKLSAAKAYAFKHNDLADLANKLQRHSVFEEVYVVTESVFSMDGDSPDLLAITQICTKYNAHLVVDEAHALGVFGYGLVQQLGLSEAVFARIVTFGKAIGCHGAAVLGSKNLKDYLINFSRSFIYTTGLPPHALANIKIAYKMLASANNGTEQLAENILFFKEQCIKLELDDVFIKSDSAIQSCVIAGNEKVKIGSELLGDKGFDVRPILSPTVPEGQERLRFCIHSYNTQKEIKRVLNSLHTFINN